LWQSSTRCARRSSGAVTGCAARLAALVLLFLAVFAPAVRAADPVGAAASTDAPFYLRDGDTVVFYGDSITLQQGYTRDIETYVLTRYPSWHVKFINSGWNGDLVSGGRGGTIETRIKRDILPYHPTVVTILLGMNDGGYTRFNRANYDAYCEGMTRLVDSVVKQIPGVRLTLLSPTLYDENALYSHHIHGYNSVMARYKDFVKKLGGQRDIPAVDLNSPMADATRRGRLTDPRFTIVPDGVHPDDAGHLLMAAVILKAWHASLEGTEITLDPTNPTQETTPLPWPLPDRAKAAFAVSPLPGALTAVQARAPDLPGDRYDLLVDNRRVGTATAQQLAAGVDLTHLAAMPQSRQADQVRDLVQKRLDAWRYLWNGGPNAVAHRSDAPTEAEDDALLALDRWLDTWRDQARDAAQPQTHTFALRPLPTRVDTAQRTSQRTLP
jgi:lysophospholipase L1-like esterase